MTSTDNPYARTREQLRLLVRLFAAAQGEAERDRLMRDIERLVLNLAEAMAGHEDARELDAANCDDPLDLTGAV